MSIAKAAVKPGFYQLGQNDIRNKHSQQEEPVKRRKWNESQSSGEGRVREIASNGNNDQRGQDQRFAGPALDERDFIRADDVNDQCLGK